MREIMVPLICQIFLMLTGALIGYMFERLRKADDKRDAERDAIEASVSQRQAAIEDGVRMILKIELRRIYATTLQCGYVTYEDETFAEEIFEKYHALGGNGQGTTMIEALRKTEMRK